MKSIFIFIFIYSISIISTEEQTKYLYRCGADDVPITPLPAENIIPLKDDKRKLSDSNFKDFNIYLDLINIKNDIIKFHLEQYEELFINSLNKAVETLETLLKVKAPEANYTFTDQQILNINISDWNKSMIGSNALGGLYTLGIDLVIFGRFDDQMEESTLANAGARYVVPSTRQPLIGVVNINTRVNYSKINSQDYFQSIIIHEFTHILGFSNHYFTNVFNNTFSKTDEYGIIRSFINSSKVLEVARKYYNCSEIDGVELEESGGSGTAGSHWEARILLGEYMNGVVYPEEQVISEFTLALLEDSGYYKANYYTGGLMRYGKNKGCDFVKKRCVNSEHEINPLFENEFYDSIYSTYMDSSCSSGRQSRAYYAWWIHNDLPEYYRYFTDTRYGGFAPADYCPVAKEYQQENKDAYYTGHCSLKGSGNYGINIIYETGPFIRINSTHGYYKKTHTSEEIYSITGETYSDHSFCYQSSLIKEIYSNYSLTTVRAICYESFCSDDSLTVKIKDEYIICPRAGGKIELEGYKGYLLCPDYNLICSGTVICNDMFDCVKKKSEIKAKSYFYDYTIKTSQNIENAEIADSDNITNYELSTNGICPIDCAHCKENKKCLKCRNSFGLLGSRDKEERICISENLLNIGYFQENNVYYKCMDNCDICSNDTSCSNCSLGFVYINNKCIKSIDNCEVYGIDDKCEKCEDNFAFNGNNRTSCLNKNFFNNYYTQDDGISYYPCESQISKCSKCYYDKNDTKIKCDLCLDNYMLYKDEEICLSKTNLNKTFFYLNETHINKCSNIIEKCDECENNNTCIKCQKEFYMINDDKHNCIDISTISINDYYLNNDKTIYYSCNNSLYNDILNCKECSDKNDCSLCKENFTFIDGNKSFCIEKEKLENKYIQDPLDESNYIKCDKIFTNCFSCNNNYCLSCKENYIFINNNYSNCVLNISSNLEQLSTNIITSDKKDNYEIFILQVQINNKRLKLYVTLSIKIDKNFHIKLTVDLYKTNNKGRNLQQDSLINKDYQIDLYINNDNNINSGDIIELTSNEEFSNEDRIVINKDKTEEFEIKVLNNNEKVLDTSENQKMIQNNEIIDFSNVSPGYSINKYYIKSSSTGCDFDLISNSNINEQSQNIILNFKEKNNNNNIIEAQCTLSKDNNKKIHCSLKQEVNNDYILDSYVGYNEKGIFYILYDNNYLQLTCKMNKKNTLSTKTIIIISIVAVVVIGIIITIIIVCCKKKKTNENEIPKNNKDFIDIPQDTQFTTQDQRNKNNKKKKTNKTKKAKKAKKKKKGKKNKN